MFGLHSRLITQLANQPGFGWNSCNIIFFFFFITASVTSKEYSHALMHVAGCLRPSKVAVLDSIAGASR